MSVKSCETCRHFRVTSPNPLTGECRWRPPVVIPKPNGVATYAWPTVKLLDWCGQWEIKPVELPAQS